MTKEEKEMLEREKNLLKEIKLSENSNQDAFYKKAASVAVEDIKLKEAMFLEASRFMNEKLKEGNIDNYEEEVYDVEESLVDSKLPKGEKINLIFHNLENYEVESQFRKIINNDVDYENDLDSILPNLFLSLKLREINLEELLQEELRGQSEMINKNLEFLSII